MKRVKAIQITDESRVKEKKKGRVLGCLVAAVAVSGVLGIGINNFLHMNDAVLHTEAKSNLGAIFTCQVAYFGEEDVYAGGPNCFELVNWAPEGGTRYSYYCGGDSIKATKPRYGECPAPEIIENTKKGFTMIAVGNIDRDSTCNIWTINNDRKLINVVNDLRDRRRNLLTSIFKSAMIGP